MDYLAFYYYFCTKIFMISIIIPVYQAEDYLVRTIQSVISQDYDDWELLLVDDGSTDRSGEICDEFATKDKRIRAFHKPNGGQSSARNYGMERTEGEYLYFMDNDDQLRPNALSTLLNLARQQDVDIAACSYTSVYDNGYEGNVNHSGKQQYLNNEEGVRLFLTREIDVYIWTKLYKRVFLISNNLRFMERGEEDFLFNIEAISRANGIVYRDTPIYIYSERSSSTSHQYAKRQLSQYVDNVMFRTEYIERVVATRYPQLSPLAIRQTLYYYVILIGAMVENSDKQPSKFNELLTYIHCHRRLFISSRKLFSMSLLGVALMAFMPPRLYFCYRKWKNIRFTNLF